MKHAAYSMRKGNVDAAIADLTKAPELNPDVLETLEATRRAAAQDESGGQ
jgi:hypothetical protein